MWKKYGDIKWPLIFKFLYKILTLNINGEIEKRGNNDEKRKKQNSNYGKQHINPNTCFTWPNSDTAIRC